MTSCCLKPYVSTPRTRSLRALRRARGEAAAIVVSVLLVSCQDTGAPSVTGRTAPTNVALAVAPMLEASVQGDPVIPIREARVRLFRLPGQSPEVAIVDTVVPFRETDDDRALTLAVVLTRLALRVHFRTDAIPQPRGHMPAASHPSCPFCDVIRGAGEVSMCYEDKNVVAFMDIQPVNPGHVLVVPREHYESLEDIPRELATHLFDVAMQLAPVVKHVGAADGMNILVNSGAAAGQDVFHYHVHVIPRCPDDGFDVPLPFAGSQMPDRTVLDANAARIISALRDPVALRQDRRVADEDRRTTSR